MPLIKRLIEPVEISRSIVAPHITNELECVSNNTFAHIVRQLGSLSAHADDLFAELQREATGVLCRVAQLNERVDRVKGRIVKLNPIVEEVSLQDINLRKPFKSSITKEQQIITQATRPDALVAIYEQRCEPPPPLRILNSYREDGRDSLKFYTDPGYFIELWCQEMAKDTENQMKKHRHKGRQRSSRPSKDQRTIREPKLQRDYAELRHGPEFVENLRSDQYYQHSSGTLTRQSIAVSEMRTHTHADIQRTGSLKSPVGATAKSADITRSSSNARNKAGTLQKMDSMPMPTSPPPYQMNRDVLADFPPPSYQADQYLPSGYQQEFSPAEMALRGLSARPLNPGQYPRATLSPSPSISIRPTMPPPAPPSATPSRVGMDMSRSSLPPPPPTPQDMSTPMSARDHQMSGQFVPTKNSPDLPPPPAWQHAQAGADFNQSPIMSPLASDDQNTSLPSPPPFLPPPPLAFGMAASDLAEPYWNNTGGMVAASAMSDTISESSSTLTRTDEVSVGGFAIGKSDSQQPMVRDTRSDLLSAIREGIQLRKVEERRQKSEQKHQQQASSASSAGGRLDVQAIMEAAFEMRRKALEENDSDDDDIDGHWSDD